MKKVTETLLVVLGVVGGIFLLSCISGVILFFIWPVAIPAVFPEVVAGGLIATKLTMWQSICLTWLCAILFKAVGATNNTKK